MKERSNNDQVTSHTISVHTEDGIWLLGEIDNYPFAAKVCDEDSAFGVDLGRTIKLTIVDKGGHKIIADHERGWVVAPRRSKQKVTFALLRFLEALPKQDIWRNTYRKEQVFKI